MPTAKNRFHILVLHLKKHIIIEKHPLLDLLLLDLYRIFLSIGSGTTCRQYEQSIHVSLVLIVKFVRDVTDGYA